jgi:putative tryptophan/tyrosine transport system substrate-binding protein
MNYRRQLLQAISVGLLATARPAIAQSQSTPRRIGFITLSSRASYLETGRYQAFLQGMKEQGFVEGLDFGVEARFSEGSVERLAVFMEEMKTLNVAAIISTGTQITSAAQKATTRIPIVVAAEADPVGNGFAKSLGQPGANITGMSTSAADLVQKHLQLITTIVPHAARVAVLVNPTNRGHATMLKAVNAAAQTRSVSIVPAEVSNASGVDQAFKSITSARADALIVLIDSLFLDIRDTLAALAVKHRLPAIFASPENARAGALLVYGSNQLVQYRRVAVFLEKIFKGAKPGDLPFEQPTQFDLIVNMKTAKTLGLKIPDTIMLQATQVIK